MTDWHDIWPESIDPETGDDADSCIRDEEVATDRSYIEVNENTEKGRCDHT